MSEQPEALRLADKFEIDGFMGDHRFAQNWWCTQAAAELRRLHAANLDCIAWYEVAKAQRDELLAALQAFIDGGYDREIAITAIAKATGKTP